MTAPAPAPVIESVIAPVNALSRNEGKSHV